MQHHSSPWLCVGLSFMKETCVPRRAQQMSHKILHEEISKCIGKVHVGTTVLCLHLSKGVGISVEFGWVWYSMLAIETAVKKDHLQYWFYLTIFNLYTDCVSWSFGFLMHITNWSSWYYSFGGKRRLEQASASYHWLFGMVHRTYNCLQVCRPCASPSTSTVFILH